MPPELLAALARVYYEAHRARVELSAGYHLSPCWEKLDAGTRRVLTDEILIFVTHPTKPAGTPDEHLAKAVLGLRPVIEGRSESPEGPRPGCS